MENNCVVSNFNIVFIQLLDKVVVLCNANRNKCVQQSDVAKVKTKIESEPAFIIQKFIIYAFKYKDIVESYNFSAVDNLNITNMSIRFGNYDLSLIGKYFEFKKLWKQLDDRSKYELFDVMKHLYFYASKYKNL